MNCKTPLKVICVCGNGWDVRLDDILHDKKCKKCGIKKMSKTQAHSIEYVRIELKKRKITLISDLYTNSNIPLEIICPNGHNCSTSFQNILAGRCCKLCGYEKSRKKQSHSFDYVKGVAIDNNIRILDDKYINSGQKMSLECVVCGGKWSTSFDSINAGHGCPHCAKNAKLTIDVIRKQIENFGLILVSKEYANSQSDIEFICSCGQQSYKKYHELLVRPYCKGCGRKKLVQQLKHPIKYVRGVIESKGGTLLSDYKNASTPLKVMCHACNNIFYPYFSSILHNDSWCPKCNMKKTQKALTTTVEDIYFRYDIEVEKRFFWLGRQSIDIYIPALKIAIEYDGEQHFKPVSFGGVSVKKAKENLKVQRIRDNKKSKLVKQHPEDIKHFIRIPYTEKITKENVKKILKNEGLI